MEPDRESWNRLAAAAALALPVLIAAAVYINALPGGFVYDDHFLVENADIIRDFSLEGIFRIFTYPDYSHYLPVRFVSYALDYRLWGLNPFWFHAENVLLHAVAAMLVCVFTARLVMAGGGLSRARAWTAGGVAAALFAAHPLNVETVAWIAGRKDLLATVFSLGAAVLYLRSYTRARRQGTDFSLAAALLLFLLALLSKASSVAVPVALAAIEIFVPPGDGQGTARARLERIVPFFAICLIVLFVDVRMSAREGLIQSWFGGGIFTHLLTISTVPLLYIQKLIWPARLCVEYRVRPEMSLFSPTVILSLLMWLGAAAWFIGRGRGRPAIAAAAAWALLNLAPVIGLVPISKLIADRYAYLPATGVFAFAGIVVAGILARGGRAARAAVWIILIAALAGFSARTVSRNADWRSDLTLWQSAVAVDPDYPIILSNLAFAYAGEKDYPAASQYYEKTLKLDPGNVGALINYGATMHEAWDRTEDAIKLFNRALELDPDNTKARANLAIALLATGETQRAIDEMIRAADARPEDDTLIDKLRAMHFLIMKQGLEVVLPSTFNRRVGNSR